MIETDKTEIESVVRNFLSQVRKTKYEFPDSLKVLQDVNKIYMLDNHSSEIMASISGNYLLSSYSLEILKRMNRLIEEKYSIKQLTLSDFEDKDKLEEIKREIESLKDEPFMIWLKTVCLKDLKENHDNLDITNVHNLNKFGHIINLSLNELKNEDAQDIELYDIHYRFQKRLDNFEMRTNAVTHLVFNNIKEKNDQLNTTKSIEVNIEFKNIKRNRKVTIFKNLEVTEEKNDAKLLDEIL